MRRRDDRYMKLASGPVLCPGEGALSTQICVFGGRSRMYSARQQLSNELTLTQGQSKEDLVQLTTVNVKHRKRLVSLDLSFFVFSSYAPVLIL